MSPVCSVLTARVWPLVGVKQIWPFRAALAQGTGVPAKSEPNPREFSFGSLGPKAHLITTRPLALFLLCRDFVRALLGPGKTGLSSQPNCPTLHGPAPGKQGPSVVSEVYAAVTWSSVCGW